MKYITLKDIAIINMGQSPDSKTYNEEKNGIPFYQGKSDFGKINPIPRVWCSNPIKIAEKDDILISVRAPIGDTNIATEKCCIGRGLASIRPLNANVNQKYLYYLLNSKYKELNKFGTGSTFKAITKDNLCNLKCVQIPDIKEQIEVVKKLDNVSQIIEIKKEQLEKLNTIIKSQFVEMFGDLEINNKKWKIVNILEVASIDTNMTKDFEKYAELPHIGIENIEKNTGKLINYISVAKSNLTSGKYIFDERHIIYSKIRPNLNKVATPDFKGLCSADSYPILTNEKCKKEYLVFVLRSDYFLNYILSYSSRTNIPKVNKEQLSGFDFPLPPIDLQNQFADIVKQIDKQKFEIENILKEMQELYESLMEKYFG